MRKKVLCVLRVSTEKQEIMDQKKEMLTFCKQEGYNEEDIIFLEGIGASAIKLNEKYIRMVETIKGHVMSNDVDAVAVWHINRLGRNDAVLVDLKNLFVKHKVQFLCKNPTLRLLNEDGSVNAGSELAYSLFSTMVQQDMAEKSAKFKRAKQGKQERGQWCGGYVAYGYKVGENNFLEVDETSAANVKLIFELYSTGKYSISSLARELKARGVTYTNLNCAKPVVNAYFRKDGLHMMLKNELYLGDKRNLTYPQIISKELYEKVQSVRLRNTVCFDKSKKYFFGAKLLRCPECGRLMYNNSIRFGCFYHEPLRFGYKSEDVCKNDCGIRIDIIDGLLWRIASEIHMDYLLDLNEDKVIEYREQLVVIQEKIDAAQSKVDTIQGRKKKIIDTYLEDYITKEERDRRLAKVDSETKEYKDTIERLREEYRGVQRLIETVDDDRCEVERMMGTLNSVIDETDEVKMYDIVHRHVKEVQMRRMDFGKAYRRGDNPSKPNGIEIEVALHNGCTQRFCYLPYVRKKHNMYKSLDGEWIEYEYDPIKRESGKAYTSLTDPETQKQLSEIADSPEHKALMEKLEKLEKEIGF